MARDLLIAAAVAVMAYLFGVGYERFWSMPPVKPGIRDDSDTGRRL